MMDSSQYTKTLKPMSNEKLGKEFWEQAKRGATGKCNTNEALLRMDDIAKEMNHRDSELGKKYKKEKSRIDQNWRTDRQNYKSQVS